MVQGVTMELKPGDFIRSKLNCLEVCQLYRIDMTYADIPTAITHNPLHFCRRLDAFELWKPVINEYCWFLPYQCLCQVIDVQNEVLIVYFLHNNSTEHFVFDKTIFEPFLNCLPSFTVPTRTFLTERSS